MSTSFVALLRGVNLGPSKKVSMPQLRSLLEELGFTAVRTYLNSGNVLLSADLEPAVIAASVSDAIATTFGHRVDVVVRSAAQLELAVEANPFPAGDPAQVTVAFLAGSPHEHVEERLATAAADYEPYVVRDREIYVNYTGGIGNSKLAARFSAVVGVSATVRNLRTVSKLAALSAG